LSALFRPRGRLWLSSFPRRAGFSFLPLVRFKSMNWNRAYSHFRHLVNARLHNNQDDVEYWRGQLREFGIAVEFVDQQPDVEVVATDDIGQELNHG
jgi:hypothetical protein